MAASWPAKLPKPTTPQASAMAFCSFTSSLSRSRPVSHLLSGDQRVVLNRRLSLCFPASLETNQWEHPELALLRPVGLTARPGRRRAEEILLVHRHALRSDAVTLHNLKIPVSTIAFLATASVARLTLPFCLSRS